MRKLVFALAAASMALPAEAALPVGATAPDFVTTGAVGGKPFKVHLKRELRKGPLVLYFFPKAFTQGCTLEAHAFSENMPEFKKAGAQVIGMSADDLPTLKKFSVRHAEAPFRLPPPARRRSRPMTSCSSRSRASPTARPM